MHKLGGLKGDLIESELLQIAMKSKAKNRYSSAMIHLEAFVSHQKSHTPTQELHLTTKKALLLIHDGGGAFLNRGG